MDLTFPLSPFGKFILLASLAKPAALKTFDATSLIALSIKPIPVLSESPINFDGFLKH